MPAISFNSRQAWVVARWAFSAYMAHVRDEVHNDPVLLKTLDTALALDGLHLSLEDRNITDRLTPILLRVADEVVEGLRPGRVGAHALDQKSQEQFQEAVRGLREFLREHIHGT